MHTVYATRYKPASSFQHNGYYTAVALAGVLTFLHFLTAVVV